MEGNYEGTWQVAGHTFININLLMCLPTQVDWYFKHNIFNKKSISFELKKP